MNKIVKLLVGNAILLGTVVLSGCGGTKAATKIDTVTDFQINAETGTFSFTGVSSAKTYYVRVYNHQEFKEDGEGKQVEVALEDKIPVAARRIRFKSDVTEYSGELDFSNLVAGNDYDAYVYTYVKNDAGDLEFAYTSPSAFVFKKHYATPSFKFKKASTSSGQTTFSDAYLVNGEVTENGDIEIKVGDNFFSYDAEYGQKDPSYQFTIYNLAEEKLDSKTLKYSDIETVTTESENACGQKQVTTTRSGSLTFNGDYDLDNYKISLKIISTNSAAFYDSEESAKEVLKDVLTPASEGGEGGGGGGGGSK